MRESSTIPFIQTATPAPRLFNERSDLIFYYIFIGEVTLASLEAGSYTKKSTTNHQFWLNSSSIEY